MSKSPSKSIVPAERDPIDKFADLVAVGINSWTEAGKILNEMLVVNPGARIAIMERHPWMTLDVLLTFERIGRRELYPKLMLDCSPGAKRLVRLPYETQQMYFSGLVTVATMEGRRIVPVEKRLQHLSAAEASLVFSDTHVRSVDEQKERLLPKIGTRSANSYTAGRSSGGGNGDRPIIAEPVSIVEEPEDEPTGIDECLRIAQQYLLKARTMLPEDRNQEGRNALITAALTPIGKLRFVLKDESEG